MGKFVNGLLNDSPSVNKMAEAMQVAPREHPRAIIDNPIGASEMPDQPPQQPPQQMPPEAAQMQQQAPQALQKPATPVLSPDNQAEGAAMPDDNAGSAQLQAPSADEEKQARILMANVVDYLYGEGMDVTAKSLKQSGKPIPETVGEIAAELVTVQMDAAEVANQTVSPDILMSVGAEVITQIYELAEALGVWQPGNEQQANQDMNTSLSYATNLFVDKQNRTGRQDRVAGLQDVAKSAGQGAYDSEPGSQFTNTTAPVGGLL